MPLPTAYLQCGTVLKEAMEVMHDGILQPTTKTAGELRAMASFNAIPHRRGVMASDILHYTTTVQGAVGSSLKSSFKKSPKNSTRWMGSGLLLYATIAPMHLL